MATFASEVSKNGTPAGIMVDSPAIVHGTFGKGAVVCISPHPEQSPEANVIVMQLLKQLSAEER